MLDLERLQLKYKINPCLRGNIPLPKAVAEEIIATEARTKNTACRTMKHWPIV